MEKYHEQPGVTLYQGDCLDVMDSFESGSVDLIYLDPPFASGNRWAQFDDVWPSLEDYVEFMRERMLGCSRVLKSTGSLYLHCDPTASHYLKVMLDGVLGRGNFRNEIVWGYRGGGVPKDAFARKHDSMLFYSKGGGNVFNKQYVPYSEASQKLVGDKGGVSIDGKPRDLDRGAAMPDWWVDINSLQTWSPERQGYPTQKPLALLERIIKASSNPGDTVLDPFMGSGTTIVAAQRLGRRAIGIEIEKGNCRVSVDRLRAF